MEIFGKQTTANLTEAQRPLYDAIIRGETIPEIVCMGGTANKDNRDKDFVLKNFIPHSYWYGFAKSKDGSFDWVAPKNEDGTQNSDGFYMNWVLSFNLK